MSEPIKFMLKPTVDAMYGILHIENCSVEGIEGIPAINRLSVSPGYMDLEFDVSCRDIYHSIILVNLPELTIKTSSAEYVIPKYNAHFEGTIQMDVTQDQHYDLRFSKLTNKKIHSEQKYYWRFVYPIDSNEWFLKIDAYPYTDDYGMNHFHNLIISNLDGHKMYLFSVNVEGKQWMIIESTEPVTYDEMDHRVLSLTIALGFVLGKRYGDYCFHIASEVQDFTQITGTEILALQKTKYCPFKILNTDNNMVEVWLQQYPYQQYALDEVKNKQTGNVRWYYNDDSSVKMNAFNKLSQLCSTSNDMMLATSMLVDGSLMNIEYQKSFFHVALETITTTLLKDDADLPPTVPQERYNDEVAPLLLEALNGIEWLSEDAKHILGNRITHNINIAPNAKKLEFCFPKYGYTLTKADSTAINMRNSTFHGHLSSEKKPLRAQMGDMLAMNLRLHKLCSILLLKAAGFEGKVLNNEVLFGMKEACERKESVYIDI